MREVLRRIRHDTGYWALRGVLAGARAAPLSWCLGAGGMLGRLARVLSPREAARASEHLTLAFPQEDEPWRRKILAACGVHLGRVLGEVCWLWSVPPDRLLARTELVGLEHLTAPLDAGNGAILVTAHCGNWEWMNLALGAAEVPMSVAAREVFDPRLDAIVQTLRGRFGGETVLRGARAGQKLVHALRRRRVVGLLIDQDIETPGVFVEFFGRPAWTPSGAAALALRTGCPVIPGFARRLPGGRMRVSFDPPLQVEPSGTLQTDVARLTAALTARIERQVRAHPEQWVWMHRRWRRQPSASDTVWRADQGTGDDD